MKYKAGTKRNIENRSGNAIKLLTSFQYASSIEPVNAKTANIAIIIQNNCLGNLSIKFCPWLFRNILSSVYFTLLYLATKYGTDSIVIQNKALLTCLYSSKSTLKNKPKLIPHQNMKFQKLSLFSRALIQFIIGLKVRIHNLTIAWFTVLSKEIIKFLVITIVSFSQNIVFAEDLSKLISAVEKKHNIPSGLLKAIAEVESGLKAYAINIAGKSFITKSKLNASKIIRFYLRKGYTNIDVGVMQINMHWHRKYFASFEEMLTPKNNVEYAAKLLTDLYSRHGDWQKAVRLYHSAKPYHHKQYSRKVLLSWLGDQQKMHYIIR